MEGEVTWLLFVDGEVQPHSIQSSWLDCMASRNEKRQYKLYYVGLVPARTVKKEDDGKRKK